MSGSLLIKNTHLLHPEAGALTGPGWLEAVDGRIAATGTGRPPASSDRDRRVIDAKGATALPGLIDAHVHLLLTTLRFHEIADWAPSYMTARAFGEAGRMLRRGFTTVRDVGGADWEMGRAIQEGLIQGPRLVFGGKALTQTGGHGDMRGGSDNSRPCCEIGPGFARIADGVDAVRAAAREHTGPGCRSSTGPTSSAPCATISWGSSLCARRSFPPPISSARRPPRPPGCWGWTG
ncbi:amidohydrolase family protein [Streptomyces sp. 029-5]|uniref:amidohydrolase family protein n=1 Tax=Streptomyces sp. 029-5 TaxID=2789261 RepID=UPI00397EBF83